MEEYFTSLFTSDSPTDFEAALVGPEELVTSNMIAVFDMEPSEMEIKEALFQIHSTKAPRPDGIHALFFRKFWHIVGADIVGS